VNLTTQGDSPHSGSFERVVRFYNKRDGGIKEGKTSGEGDPASRISVVIGHLTSG
jgi:hypothetical protein